METVTLVQLTVVVLTIYAIVVAVFLVLENRSPQSTLAWLPVLLLLPGIGLFIYLLAGRTWRAFSHRGELVKVVGKSNMSARVRKVLQAQPAHLERLAKLGHLEYTRLATLLWNSGRSLLTFHNELEILQDASEKYPRLLGDIENAEQFVHMLYYEWASDPFTEKLLAYFTSIAPAGVTVKAYEHHGGEPYMTPIDSDAYKAAAQAIKATFGKEPIPVRGGGSIPICSLFEKELGIKIVFMGFGLDSDNLHSPNEKYDIANYYKGIETIPYFHKFFAEMK